MITTRLSNVHLFAVTAAGNGWEEAQRFSRTSPNRLEIGYVRGERRLDVSFSDGNFAAAHCTAPGADPRVVDSLDAALAILQAPEKS